MAGRFLQEFFMYGTPPVPADEAKQVEATAAKV